MPISSAQNLLSTTQKEWRFGCKQLNKLLRLYLRMILCIKLTDLYSLLVLRSRPRISLILRSLLLHGHLMLLFSLLSLDEHLISLTNFRLEVLIVGQQPLEINSGFIKEHTSDSGCILFSVSLVNSLVNVVTNEVTSIITLESIELSNINLRKL